MAELFGDSPQMVRVLAGQQAPPAGAEAQGLADRIEALPAADRRFVVRMVELLSAARK